jgi:very-short-patch-repair endonuclease
LRALGLSSAAIADRVARGRLVRRHHGVYVYGHRHLRIEGVYLAAVLACGEGAALSHRSAGGHHDLRPDSRARIDVTVPRRGGHARPGIDIHRSRALTPSDVEIVDGVPCTTWSRTIVDLADLVPQHHVAKLLDRAEELQLMDVPTLLDTLTRAGRRRGRGRLLRALHAHDPDGALLRSWLEERLLALIAAARLPRPLVNHHVLTHEVDLHWPGRRLVVEADSWRHHGRRRAFRKDRARDRALQLAGWRVLRFTHADIVDTPAQTAAQLTQALAPRL